MNHDPVNHPTHYCSHLSGIEAITITREMSFNVGNAFKYLYRCDKKENMVQDIKKAIWYIEDEIKRREGFRWKFLRENPFYRSCVDGTAPIKAILAWEDRFGGHMCWTLDNLYCAHALPRSVGSLKSALATCKYILKVWV